MRRTSNILMISCLLALGIGCGSDDGGDQAADDPTAPEPTTTPEPLAAPEPAVLVFPLKDSECEEGSEVTGEESTIAFEWTASANTDSYELNVLNLNTSEPTVAESDVAGESVRLERGVPYEWYVVSKSSSVEETAKSEVWRFYNQGEGIINYVPFPAQLIAPEDRASIDGGLVDLEWSGQDVDGDIVGYDVYLGTDSPPDTVLAMDLVDGQIDGADVNEGTYYWYVVTKDSAGNESESQIFSFTVRE